MHKEKKDYLFLKNEFLFIGRGRNALFILKKLLKKNINFSQIWVSKKYNESCREQFITIAKSNKISIKFIQNLDDKNTLENLKKLKVKYVICLFWKFKIKEEVLKISKFVNLHFGLLPKYRGNACINWAIINNEKYSGVTIHFMDKNLDAGPIISQKKIKLNSNDNITILNQRFLDEGEKLIHGFIDDVNSKKKISPKIQSSKDSFRCYPRIPRDGIIDWNKNTRDILNLIRSLGPPYPYAYTFKGIKKIEIIEAEEIKKNPSFLATPGHILDVKDDNIIIATKNNQILIKKIRVYGKKNIIKPGVLFKSIRERLGLDIELILNHINK